MKYRSYNQFFEVIANPTRMRIIEALHKSPKSVTEICNKTKEEQSKISHNLKILMNCHFLECQKDGKKRIYSLNENTIVPLLKIANNHVSFYCNKKCWMKK